MAAWRCEVDKEEPSLASSLRSWGLGYVRTWQGTSGYAPVGVSAPETIPWAIRVVDDGPDTDTLESSKNLPIVVR